MPPGSLSIWTSGMSNQKQHDTTGIGSHGMRKKRRFRWKRWVFGVPLGLLLPFMGLVRFSTWLYLDREMGGWLSVAVAGAAAALGLTIVLAIIGRRFGLKTGMRLFKLTGTLLVVYCVYLLVYVSAANVKTDDVRATYVRLHPVLRVAVSTFVVMDGDAVITDARRVPEDYARMGLSAPEQSLHFGQSDGFVHALDFRTRGRLPVTNTMTDWYFRLMGFSTLRHTGTADHLHVSLPVNQGPAIP